MALRNSDTPAPDTSDTVDTASADDSLDAAALAFASLDDDGDDDETTADDGLDAAAAALSDAPDDAPEEPDAASTDPVIEFTGEDGQVVRLPQSEIGKGYLRQADYTRKTQAAAEKTKDALALAARYAAGLQTIEQVLAAEIPDEPDWSELRQTLTPEEFAAEQAEYSIKLRRFEKVQKERSATESRLRDAAMDAQQAHTDAEAAKLSAAIPEWKDAAIREKETKALVAYAITALGFSEEDVANVSDHRAFLMLRKSMKYDALMTQARTAALNKGRTVTRAPSPPASRPSGTSTARPSQEGFDKAKARSGRSGSVQDAAAALDALFGD